MFIIIIGLHRKFQVPQGIESNGLQLHIAPLGQLNQGFQISGMEQGFLQQAVGVIKSIIYKHFVSCIVIMIKEI